MTSFLFFMNEPLSESHRDKRVCHTSRQISKSVMKSKHTCSLSLSMAKHRKWLWLLDVIRARDRSREGQKNSNLSIAKRGKKCAPWSPRWQILNKLWSKGSWFQTDSAPPYKRFTGNMGGGRGRREFQRSHVIWKGGANHSYGRRRGMGGKGGGGGYVPFPAQMPLNRVTLLNCLGVGSGEFTDCLTLSVLGNIYK